jgi:predicted porin
MNKKIIALAVGAALSAPMIASADTSVYGRAQLELADRSSNGNAGAMALEDNKNTRFGIKFSEDLGGGMKAVGQFEFGMNFLDAPLIDGSPSSKAGTGIYARNSAVGLSGDFGKVISVLLNNHTNTQVVLHMMHS